MEIIKLLWIVEFFFFTLILIFIWAKMVVISNKVTKVIGLVKECDKIGIEVDVEKTPDSENG